MSKFFIIIIPVLTIVLIRLNPFDILLRTFNTLIHELSHALLAVLTGNKAMKIELNKDFSGVCVTKSSGKMSKFLISVAGYTLPSVAGYIMIVLIKHGSVAFLFPTLTIICIIAMIFLIRNTFGIIWTLCFCGINFMFIYIPLLHQYYYHIIYIYANILLSENLLSAFTLLYISLTNSKKAGDATNLAKITRIPAVVWSLLFVIFVVFLYIQSIKTVSAVVI